MNPEEIKRDRARRAQLEESYGPGLRQCSSVTHVRLWPLWQARPH